MKTYLKIIDIASTELYKNQFNLSDKELDQSRIVFIQDALNAYNDMFFMGLLIILNLPIMSKKRQAVCNSPNLLDSFGFI